MQPSSYKKDGKRLCNPMNWYVSEKFDGFKIRWIKGKLYTRAGQELKAPEWFIKLLPSEDIEGEAYFGKNTFHKTASLRSESNHRTWTKICFYVFDLINYELTWIERQAKLEEIAKEWKDHHIKLVSWKEIKSIAHLEQEFQQIIKNDGEGVILADPWGLYKDGHVEHILKYKKAKDAEAIIVGYRIDETKACRLVSLEVNPLNEHTKKPNEKLTFNIGTGLKVSDRYKYQDKFPIGTIVTYTYELMGANGKPRTPVYKGIRVDIK